MAWFDLLIAGLAESLVGNYHENERGLYQAQLYVINDYRDGG